MSDLPRALTFYEAHAQLAVSVWDLIGTALPMFADYAEVRSVEAWATAFEIRADLVGREQAGRDYFPEEGGA